MNITDRLMQLDPTLERHNEGHWDKPFDPNMPGYSSFNDAGIECETGEFLYGMVRILKPNRVLETGSHWGVGASYLGLALKDNEKGHLATIEFTQENHYKAVKRVHNAIGLTAYVTLNLMDIRAFNPLSEGYELILLDTEPQIRFAELIKFFPFLKPGGFIFIHDLNGHMAQVDNYNPDHPDEPLWPWGPLPEQIKQWVRDDVLRPFHFATPRGLTGFYKVHKNDYKWKL